MPRVPHTKVWWTDGGYTDLPDSAYVPLTQAKHDGEESLELRNLDGALCYLELDRISMVQLWTQEAVDNQLAREREEAESASPTDRT